MKLGVLLVLFGQKTLEEALDYAKKCGVEAVEIGTGNYPGNAHCRPEELLANPRRIKEFKKAIEDRGLILSALSCHGNPLHPDSKIAARHREVQRQTIRLAEKLGLDTIITFSGCPAGGPDDRTPNWITCPWPEDYSRSLAWQWEKQAVPYWRKEAAFAADHGVKKIALEMHPGFLVYNPETLLKLRTAVGPAIGANFDPSHLFWQGIDPVRAVTALEGAVFHCHAKDTRIDHYNTALNGVLDTKPYGNEKERSWIFRTVGYGHDQAFWKDFISALRLSGYDGVLSIEHEDSLLSGNEGFLKAVRFLKEVIVSEPRGAMWWA
ncbi:MAG TPA: sugar phosphate isomerase/epimerase [bacterium]|uniref:Xylose isomerase-like TIM barrel n=1 Tax=candidate division TA06 bacterium ADurb.Bin417 TaxID=1852828 RepID=A0A1V5MBC9_UNCT6|nr:MAG: Xylose isomerase-like TIM barrel [candidate division TA06 bacterium ADurb.Bin417]HNQ36211.1 sugar phosphate isomerase/epimerase [bacterium]HNS49133.1 sugar phosphate isomerase/epimerase [bacterium]